VGTYLPNSSDIYSEGGPPAGLLLTETAGHWTAGVEARLPANASSYGTSLDSVSCASVGNCTAVGGYPGGYSTGGLLFTEKAGQWKRGVEYGDIYASLNSVSCASDGTCSAVGYQDYSQGGRDSGPSADGLLLTKRRGKWREENMPNLPPSEGVLLTSVSCAPGGNCTAIGTFNISIDTSVAPGGLLLNEKAGKWVNGVMAKAPRNAKSSYWGASVGLGGVSCAAPGECNAAGSYFRGANNLVTLVSQKAGTWRPGVEAFLPRDTNSPDPSAVSCASPGNCTVVGNLVSGAEEHGFLLTEIAGRLARGVRTPHFTGSRDSIYSVSCGAPGNCGAVGVDWTPAGPSYGVLFDSTTGPCVVPELRGATPATAMRRIESHNCSVGTIEHVHSRTTKTGHVISQAPQPRRHLAPGASVAFTVSSGA
jgi:hypothetical protein